MRKLTGAVFVSLFDPAGRQRECNVTGSPEANLASRSSFATEPSGAMIPPCSVSCHQPASE